MERGGLRMLKWSGGGDADGPWTTLAVRKGEKVNCDHSRIPDVHPIQQRRSKSCLHDNILLRDPASRFYFALTLQSCVLCRIHLLCIGIYFIFFHPGSCSENCPLPPFWFNHQGTFKWRATSMTRHLFVRQNYH